MLCRSIGIKYIEVAYIELFFMHQDHFFVHSVEIFYLLWTAMSENKVFVIVTNHRVSAV